MQSTEPDYESLAEFLYLCPVALAQIDNDGRVSMMSAKGAQIFMQIARRPDIDNLFDVLADTLPQLPDLVNADLDRKGVVCENLRVNAGRPSKRSKRDLVFLVTVVRIGANRLLATAQDISWSAEQEKQARDAEERLRLLTQGARDVAIIPLTPDGRVMFWHSSAERLFGHPSGTATGTLLSDLLKPDLRSSEDLPYEKLLNAAMVQRQAEGEGWVRRHGRTTFWSEVAVTRVDNANGEVDGLTVVARDATRRHRERLSLLHRAQYDHLTGLPNRAHFEELTQLEFSRWRRSKVAFSVGLLDIDHFKRVNDTFGHTIGDAVLKDIARRCKHVLRDVDAIGRYGGEEFVVIFAGTDLEGSMEAAERLRADIASYELLTPDGATVRVTASIGVAQVDSDIKTLERLLNRADHALYRAKEGGRNKVVAFAPETAPVAGTS